MMFGAKCVSAVQDPSYPVYVDTSVMMGQTGSINPETNQFKNIVYMPCNPSNNFFPDEFYCQKILIIKNETEDGFFH
jgi:LL-diaminopimelate aminotransferase